MIANNKNMSDKRELSGAIRLGNLLGTIGLISTAIYFYRKDKDLKFVAVSAVIGGICGFALGNAIYKFYTYDQDYVINT
jgi:hypothetical protein